MADRADDLRDDSRVTRREGPLDPSEVHDDDRIGARIGHFVLRAKLGAGGMGVVYEALDERLGRPVALKMLSVARADAGLRARFLREARAVSRVQHPNVATIYEVGEDGAAAYIALELVPGQTMRSWLAADRSFAERLRVVHAIAEAVAAAHAAGVVHRDLKPENVMITPAGVPKVLDFGLARHAESGSIATDDTRTAEGIVMGTPSYMSPEQVRGERVDARGDVFALGVILYETFAGVRPFRGESPGAIVLAMGQPHAPLRVHAPDVPRALDVVVERCLAKDPAARYPDARAVADALALVAPAPGGERARRSVLAFAAVALIVVGVGAYSFLRPNDAQSSATPARSAATANERAPVPSASASTSAELDAAGALDAAAAGPFVPRDAPEVLAHLARAGALAGAGKLDEARAELDACVKDEPAPVACIVQRSRLLAAQGSCADAEADARAAFELAPARTDARIALADVLASTSPNPDAATRALAGADAGAVPTDPEIERARAGLDLWRGDFDGAIARLRAMRDDARGPVGAALLAGALREIGRDDAPPPPPAAAVDAGGANALPWDEPRAGRDGQAALAAGRVDEALPLLDRAVHACDGVSFPLEHVASAFALGQAAEAKGDRTRACFAYAQVLARWNAGRPLPLTARKARARATLLQCGG